MQYHKELISNNRSRDPSPAPPTFCAISPPLPPPRQNNYNNYNGNEGLHSRFQDRFAVPAHLTGVGIASTAASPAAPLSLRATTNPGLARTMDHRPSSPVASPLTAPPTHFGAFSPFWATMSDDIKKNLAAVPFAALEKALQDAKFAAAKKATQLAEAEFRQIQAKLKTEKAVVTTAICTAEDELADLKRRTRECEHRLGSLEVRERSKSDALLASSKRHNAYTADDRTPDSDTDTPAAAAHTSRASDNPLTAAAVKGQSSVL